MYKEGGVKTLWEGKRGAGGSLVGGDTLHNVYIAQSFFLSNECAGTYRPAGILLNIYMSNVLGRKEQ